VAGVRVVGREDWGGGELSLERKKCGVLKWTPHPRFVLSEEREEGGAGFGKVKHEAAIVVGESEERAKFVAVAGRRPVSDAGELAGVGGDAVVGDDVTEEPDGCTEQLALGWFGAEAGASEGVENSRDVEEVIVEGSGVDANIVDELRGVSSVDVLPQDVCDVALERSRSIGEAEGHHPEFVLSERGDKGWLVLVFRDDGDLPVPPEKVDFGEVLAVPSTIEEVFRVRKRKTVANGLGVEGAVVDTHTEAPVVLRREQHRGGIGAGAGDHKLSVQEFAKLALELLDVRWAEAIRGLGAGPGPRHLVDAVGDGGLIRETKRAIVGEERTMVPEELHEFGAEWRVGGEELRRNLGQQFVLQSASGIVRRIVRRWKGQGVEVEGVGAISEVEFAVDFLKV
jgi:hypothetical protein